MLAASSLHSSWRLAPPKYMWSTGNTGFQPGKFYARATRKPGCLPDSSKSVNAQR